MRNTYFKRDEGKKSRKQAVKLNTECVQWEGLGSFLQEAGNRSASCMWA